MNGLQPVQFGQTQVQADPSTRKQRAVSLFAGQNTTATTGRSGWGPITLLSALFSLLLVGTAPASAQTRTPVAEPETMPFVMQDSTGAIQEKKLVEILGLNPDSTHTTEEFRAAFLKLYLEGFGKTLIQLRESGKPLPIESNDYMKAFEKSFEKPLAEAFGIDIDNTMGFGVQHFFRLMEVTIPRVLGVSNYDDIHRMAQQEILDKLHLKGRDVDWWLLATQVLDNPAMTNEHIRELFGVPETDASTPDAHEEAKVRPDTLMKGNHRSQL